MVAPVLPALAVAALTDPIGTDRGMLCASRRSVVVHALLDSGRSLTPTGRVRRSARPLCGRAPRAWRPASYDGRPLCRTCSRVLHTMHGPAALSAAATRVTPADLAQTLLRARDLATVSAAQSLLIESGHTGKAAPVDGRPVRLTQLVAQARERVRRAERPLTIVDDTWLSFVERAPARRFPRRLA